MAFQGTQPKNGEPHFVLELCLYEQFEVRDEDDQTSFKIKEQSGNWKCKGL